jgi:hypothetical protein
VPVPLRDDEFLTTGAGAEGGPYDLEPGAWLLNDPGGAAVPAAGGAMERLAAGEFHAWPAGVPLRRNSRCKLRSSSIRKRSALGTVDGGP